MAIQPHNPPHPGELINRTYIEPFDDISVASVARELGVAKSTFSRLVNGKADISPEMAVRLSAVLGRAAESWLALQDHCDLWEARQAVDTDDLH
ncbi:MAG: HigA family addiction module antidote protein [Candidatus Thiodiazotropha sp. (ex Lucinoma aequizonata)]|nr:HigA family addiction module antidote protein [Candidatus Thiodiazotropha sp. (ex Lucinoma aequizonata)]MCU7889423.1 HigA family addiction module antidote protein [Candidatus Thiodiazotropha sp. (ex Lucinoma aequizonata)]MCU7897164.1 HigA family addiction module antidote protein [Candidatus Thiodiazotropha sp. (ex Lucinoma aequizonata)]MCU7897628.1 HigA family addiction module antidote protein [Candidatus Thiodiazotropha sp. (ex Lucinoma aequizonata)]MCU7903126.1 HigA family addiction module